MAEYFRGTPNADIKSQGIAPLGASGIILPTWYNGSLWGLSGGALSAVTSGSGVPFTGYCAGFTDGMSGAWFLRQILGATHITSGGALTQYTAPAGIIFAGGVFAGGQPNFMDSTGAVWTVSGSVLTMTGNTFGGAPAKAIAASGNTLYAMLPAVSQISSMAVTGGAITTLTTPMPTPACLAVSGTDIAVAGWGTSALSPGATFIAPDTFTQLAFLGLNPASGSVTLWSSIAGVWSAGQVVSGLGAPSAARWSPNGITILVTDPAGSHVFALTDTFGTLSLAQTLALAGAEAVDITPDASQALVATGSTLQNYNFAGTVWSASGVTSLPGASCISFTSDLTAMAGATDSLKTLAYTAGTWVITGSTALPFTPTNVAFDPSGLVYAIGTSGVSGVLAAVSGTTVVASDSWSGSASGLIVVRGQPIVADPTFGVRIFSLTANVLSQTGSGAAPAGVVSLTSLGSTVFVGSESVLWENNLGAPSTIRRSFASSVSVYSGAWVSTNLPAGQTPTAISWSPSGSVVVVTQENELFTLAASGGILSQDTIPVFAGQQQTTPLGLSTLLWVGNSLFASSILNDSLVQVI